MYPWLLVVISVPSANWARLSTEATAALLEIDLLGIGRASQLSRSRGNAVTQSLKELLDSGVS